MNSELQNYIQQFDKQLFLNELSCKYDQLKTETGEKAKIENQKLVEQLVVLPGLKNEVDELKQRNVLLVEKSEKESNMLEHAEKELEGLKSEGSDQNEYSS